MDPDLGRKQLAQVAAHRCAYLFFALLALLLLGPSLADTAHGRLAVNSLNIVVLLTATAAVGRTRLSVVVDCCLALPCLAFQIIGLYAGGGETYFILSWAFGAAFYLATVSYLLRYVFRAEAVTTDNLFGAAAAYLLLGLLWTYLYALLQSFHPGAFAMGGAAFRATVPDLLYFSFTVLTTTGLGDIVPVLPLARSLANLEEITGVLFVAIQIARLAGMTPPGPGR